MISDAESHAGEAHRLRELADARNAAEQLAYQTERTLSEHRDKLPEADAATIEGRVMELRQAVEGADLADIQAKTAALEEASRGLADAIYAQASRGPGERTAVRERRQRVRRRGRRGRRLRGHRRRGSGQVVSDELIDTQVEEPAARGSGSQTTRSRTVTAERDEYLDPRPTRSRPTSRTTASAPRASRSASSRMHTSGSCASFCRSSTTWSGRSRPPSGTRRHSSSRA